MPGETVLLHVINGGLEIHEAVVGDGRSQLAWEAAEAAVAEHPPGPTPFVADPAGFDGVRVVVGSGQRVDTVWTVPADAASGAWFVGCHIPGHFGKGMVVPVRFVGPDGLPAADRPRRRRSPRRRAPVARAIGDLSTVVGFDPVPFDPATGRATRSRRASDHGVRHRRALHRRARPRVRVRLPRGLHPLRGRRRPQAVHRPERVHRLRRLRARVPGERDLPRREPPAGVGDLHARSTRSGSRTAPAPARPSRPSSPPDVAGAPAPRAGTRPAARRLAACASSPSCLPARRSSSPSGWTTSSWASAIGRRPRSASRSRRS